MYLHDTFNVKLIKIKDVLDKSLLNIKHDFLFNNAHYYLSPFNLLRTVN